MSNFVSFAASIAELAYEEKSRTQSLTHPAYLRFGITILQCSKSIADTTVCSALSSQQSTSLAGNKHHNHMSHCMTSRSLGTLTYHHFSFTVFYPCSSTCRSFRTVPRSATFCMNQFNLILTSVHLVLAVIC